MDNGHCVDITNAMWSFTALIWRASNVKPDCKPAKYYVLVFVDIFPIAMAIYIYWQIFAIYRVATFFHFKIQEYFKNIIQNSRT